MNARFATYATAIIVVMVGVLLLRGAINFIPEGDKNLYVDPYSVNGIEVVYKGLPYTLNFEQQQDMVDAINRLLPMGKLRGEVLAPAGFEKIVLYLFDKKPIEMLPIDFHDNELAFKVKEWNPDGYLMDVSAGSMWRLVESSHD